jgi:hypothetical protein
LSPDDRLLLVTAGSSATTGTLELSSLRPDVRFDVGARGSGGAEVSAGLAGVSLALKQDGVLAGGGAESQLVEGQDLSACRKKISR